MTPDAAAGHFRRVSEGIAIIGGLISASSIINLLVRGFSIDPSRWLAKVIEAHRALFHPIVDALIGWVPHLLGYRLTEGAKDAIVLYLTIGAMCGRSVIASRRRLSAANAAQGIPYHYGSAWRSFGLVVAMALLWPVFFGYGVLFRYWRDSVIHWLRYEEPTVLWVSVRNSTLQEAAFIVAVVCGALLFNEAGILS